MEPSISCNNSSRHTGTSYGYSYYRPPSYSSGSSYYRPTYYSSGSNYYIPSSGLNLGSLVGKYVCLIKDKNADWWSKRKNARPIFGHMNRRTNWKMHCHGPKNKPTNRQNTAIRDIMHNTNFSCSFNAAPQTYHRSTADLSKQHGRPLKAARQTSQSSTADLSKQHGR